MGSAASADLANFSLFAFMRFNLKVYREQGGLQQLQLEALDSIAAQRLAEEQGYTVLATAAATTRSWLGLGPPGFSLPLFVQELLALLEAGMGLVEALAILNKKARSPETQRVLGTLSQLLSEGRTFSRALESVPETFPVLFVATVRSSEQTGNVHEALRRYLAYHRQLHALREKMISASVYPLLLALVGILVVVFLMVYVVPRFSKVYEDVGQGNLPFLSLLLMNWGRWAGEHVSIVVFSLVGVLGTAIYLAVHPATRAMIERRLWALPVLGEHLYVMQLSRFTRTVAMLLKGGVPLLSALEMTADLLRQPALQRGLEAAQQAIAEGRSVSDAFTAGHLATEVGVRLLVVGERSGDLGDVMERIAAFYDEETARAVEWFSRLFEPLLMVLIGLVIGGIVVMMYLPIFELASSIQ